MGRRDMSKPAILFALLAAIELYRVGGYVPQQAVEGTKQELPNSQAFREVPMIDACAKRYLTSKVLEGSDAGGRRHLQAKFAEIN